MNTAHVDELERIEMDDGFVWRPVRRHFGIEAFGVNAYSPREAGAQVVEEHTESQLGHEEIYLVLRGRARFTIDGNEHELGPGQLVFVRDPSLKRGAVGLDEDTLVLALGGKPGDGVRGVGVGGDVRRGPRAAGKGAGRGDPDPRGGARRARRAPGAALQPRVHGGARWAPSRRAAPPAARGRARAEVDRRRRGGQRLRRDPRRARVSHLKTASSRTIVAIVSSHNRRESTLRALTSFFGQSCVDDYTLSAVLADAGSSDSTADAVAAAFRSCTVVAVSDLHFWASAMAIAERRARERSPDFLLWLNDDVELHPNALSALLAPAHQAHDAIVAGRLADPVSGKVYLRRRSDECLAPVSPHHRSRE